MRPPKDKESIKKFAQTRVEELEGFVNGLFGDEEALELPESAHVAVKNLGDVRSTRSRIPRTVFVQVLWQPE